VLVRLVIRLEETADGLVWWADSPDVGGFTAAGDSLKEMLTNAELAIREERHDVEFSYLLVEPTTGSDPTLRGLDLEQELVA